MGDSEFPDLGPFADALKDRFAREGYEKANTEFGSDGFRDDFIDPDPTSSNQARHYVGAFRAAAQAGKIGQSVMNWRERPRKNDTPLTRRSHEVDLALNRVAFRHVEMLKTGLPTIRELQQLILKDVCKQ